ncbi:acetyltransferase [Burkholderia sp. Ac-20379]|uniref:acetyltransferase n=1 Tax=Burkholderia sp. Ac-20379 TaxID=2703900 RepID=UPI0019807C36|nr:acetyltransferase [Burkholderia sp. Ac-20379]MBN3722616.1 acetyltransferase [Burkholderia sp. Ac-20379]
MNVTTSDDCTGILKDHPLARAFIVFGYRDGTVSTIPNNFFKNWIDEEATEGTFHIEKGSGLGVGSIVKYDGNAQRLRIGKYVAGGQRLRFLLNGQHDMRSISMTMFSTYGNGMLNPPPPQYADTEVHNDVWIGDEAMILGGSVIQSGCVIGARSLVPPNFRSEPYAVYAGSPARLIKFRFPERVRDALFDLAWWDMPLQWVKQHNDAFLVDLTADEGRSLEVLAELKRAKFAEQRANPRG